MQQSHTLSLITIVLIIILVSACVGNPPAPTATSESQLDWSYQGDNGPGKWASLDSKYALCASGKSQSPIDIQQAQRQDLPDIAFHYQPSLLKIVNNGHTIELDYPDGSNTITLDGSSYRLVQFHFHTPSEHQIDGQATAMELHLVHKDAKGRLAVIGVLVKEGEENRTLVEAWAKLPHSEGEQPLDSSLDASQLLPRNRSSFRYAGSLTTPPCSEGVRWTVLEQPIEMSAAQIAAFRTIYPSNNRPLQPLNTRAVIEDATK